MSDTDAERLGDWLRHLAEHPDASRSTRIMARKALDGETYEAPEPKHRKCSICGAPEEDVEYLTDVRVITCEGQEGYSDVTQLFCEEHTAEPIEKLMELGFRDHNHGGTAMLADRDCVGDQYDPQTHLLLPCPTPTDPYEDRYVVGNYDLYRVEDEDGRL